MNKPLEHALQPIEREHLWDQVYAQLRDALFAGKFEPGGRLVLRELADTLGTSITPVRDAVARQFATGFYTALGRGETIGAAMAAGQSTLVEAHGLESLLWADHLLYGDPTWSIEPRSNLLSDDFDVLDGLEAKYRSDLDAPEPTRRLLAATMLLRLGDRAAVGALGRDLELIGTWTGADATRQQRRQAALVIRAMAAAAGLEPDGDADPDSEALPDMAAVRALHARLAARLDADGGVG